MAQIANAEVIEQSVQENEAPPSAVIPFNTIKTKQGYGYRFVKRAFDIVCSLAASLILLIPMAVIAVVIVIKDPGNPFYIQTRVGKNGEPIRLLKFRSMKKGADDLEAMLTPEQLAEYKREFKLRDDPRLIGWKKPGDGRKCFGSKIRTMSIDELPQILYNVCLRGDMSLVGPRPILREELEKYYSPQEQELLLSVKPGITGLWQTQGRNNCTYEDGERQKVELEYAKRQGIALDLKILVKTMSVVLDSGGAY